MATNPVNTKSFSLTNIASKGFSLVLSGFQFATSLFFRVISKINVDINVTVLVKAVTALRLRRVKLTTSTKLIGTQIQSINLRKVKLNLVLTTEGSDLLLVILRNQIQFVSSAIQKAVTSLKAGIHNLDIIPTIALFFILGYYDPDTLGTWDSSTLGAMDYTT